jgi:hypothetical protein
LQEALALQVAERHDPHLRGEVYEVLIVGNLVDINPAEEVRRDLMLVLERERAA